MKNYDKRLNIMHEACIIMQRKITLHLFRIGIELGKRSLNGEKTQIGVSQRRKEVLMIKAGIIGATGYAGGETGTSPAWP